jgi:hypothetical protein
MVETVTDRSLGALKPWSLKAFLPYGLRPTGLGPWMPQATIVPLRKKRSEKLPLIC